MARARERGMEGRCAGGRGDQTRKTQTDMRADIQGFALGDGVGGLRPSGHGLVLTSARAIANPRWVGERGKKTGGARRSEDGGGGDKDEGTTLVIGSLATVGLSRCDQ